MKKAEVLIASIVAIILLAGAAVLIVAIKKDPYDYGSDSGTGSTILIEKIITSDGAINNPGNIRITSSKWQGKIESPSDSFESFSSMAYGYRAMIKILQHYYSDGKKTLAKMISTYAPSSENNTSAYINAVSSATGINPNEDMNVIVYGSRVKDVIQAMSKHEQGATWYAQNFNIYSLNEGYNLV